MNKWLLGVLAALVVLLALFVTSADVAFDARPGRYESVPTQEVRRASEALMREIEGKWGPDRDAWPANVREVWDSARGNVER